MRHTISAILAATLLLTGMPAAVMASPAPMFSDTPSLVLLDEDDEDVVLEVDEPVESGDILVDEDGDVWEVQ